MKLHLCVRFTFFYCLVNLISIWASALLLEGDICDEGICTILPKCFPAEQELKKYSKHNFTRCGFDNFTEIVCCPGTIDQRIINSKENRKSVTACDNYTKNVTIFLNYQITGGADAALGEFPHMAVLGFYSTSDRLYKFNCGATLISSTYLVTAAHCILNRDSDKAKIIRIGAVKVPQTTEVPDDLHDYKVKTATPHPNYKRRKFVNDIALVELENEVIFGDYIRPACLYTSEVDPKEFVITGWGEVSWNNTWSDNLQKGTVTSVPFEECSRKYKTSYGLNLMDSQLCAIHDKTDTCQGDSGGPLQLRNSKVPVLVGITSIGGSICGGGFPSVYTRIYKYLDWIETIVWP